MLIFCFEKNEHCQLIARVDRDFLFGEEPRPRARGEPCIPKKGNLDQPARSAGNAHFSQNEK